MSSTMGFAQTQRVSRFEGGFYVLPTLPLGSFYNGDHKMGGGFGIDFRHNVKNSPWDYGAYLEFSTAAWDFWKTDYGDYQQNRSLVLGVASHYNFRQGAVVNPYAGLGLGLAVNDAVNAKYDFSKMYSLAVSPRFGVELLRHVRIGCQANITRKGFHSIGLNVGIAFGGGRRK